MKEQLPESSIANIGQLQALIQIVFDFLARFRQYMAATPANIQYEPLFEIAIQDELYQLLFRWLSEEATAANPPVSQGMVEATAHVVSWGIFDSAVQWSRTPHTRTPEEMVQDVLVVVAAGLEPVMA